MNKLMNKLVKKILKIVVIVILLILLLIFLININIILKSKKYIYSDISKVPQMQTGLILGAYVHPNGVMSDMLKDRATTTLELYNTGKIKKILISGDHGTKNYDEVNVLKKFFLENKVKKEDIFLDHAGFDTFDSMYRAKSIFQVDSIIVITQNFHLPRAVYIGKKLGINTVGFVADKHQYVAVELNYLREYIARIKAWANIVFKSESKYLGEIIPITGDSVKSWD